LLWNAACAAPQKTYRKKSFANHGETDTKEQLTIPHSGGKDAPAPRPANNLFWPEWIFTPKHHELRDILRDKQAGTLGARAGR
jgi:hypothetical protein